MFGKIAGLLLLRKTMSDSSSLIESLLAGMAAVAMLTLISTLLFGMLILGGVYIGHQLLLAAGMAPLPTALILGGVLLFLFILCTVMAFSCARAIRNIPKRVASMQAPIGSRVSELTDAFISGLNTPSPPH